MSALHRVNALTEAQRAAALDSARRRIAGREPLPADFAHLEDSRYPTSVIRIIRALSGLMLMAAFLPSAMRLHAVGLLAFSLHDASSRYVAALSIVLMAEVGQVIFSLATIAALTRWQRLSLAFGAAVCTLIALSGNYTSNAARAFADLFSFLDTFAPPVLVLITAQVLKSQMLHAVAERHRARVEYARAHGAWKAAYDAAHDHARWLHAAANALRDALRAANKVSKAVLRELTDADWRALILRELEAENWWQRAEDDADRKASQALHAAEMQAARAKRDGGSHTGELAGAVTQRSGGAYVGTCPHCGQIFEKESEQAAMKSLVAHLRFCVARNGGMADVT